MIDRKVYVEIPSNDAVQYIVNKLETVQINKRIRS